MKTLLETLWDFACTVALWFALVIVFFLGLFLMGFTFKIIANAFMAGYYIL